MHAAVAAQAAETPSMGPACTHAGQLAATAGMRHMRQLHANMPQMHATPALTWCCCGKARATKEWQMMAHAREQGRAGQHVCQAQVDNGVVCNQLLRAMSIPLHAAASSSAEQ
jgi:hypothetical protein